jgi:endonuclease YncB( thermonuclease family)
MPRRPPFLIALIIIAIVAAIGSGVHEWHSRPTAKPPSRTGENFTGRPRVVDGDSLELAGHRVRLFGIDAPESRQDCRDARGRFYACGREARDALAQA